MRGLSKYCGSAIRRGELEFCYLSPVRSNLAEIKACAHCIFSRNSIVSVDHTDHDVIMWIWVFDLH